MDAVGSRAGLRAGGGVTVAPRQVSSAGVTGGALTPLLPPVSLSSSGVISALLLPSVRSETIRRPREAQRMKQRANKCKMQLAVQANTEYYSDSVITW